IVEVFREQARSYSVRSKSPPTFVPVCSPPGNIASQNGNNIATKYLAGYLSTARQAVYKVTPQISQKDD
ncbi:hypothetical protein, partial [Pseudomonas carnis]